jgi:Inovirus Coat protein B
MKNLKNKLLGALTLAAASVPALAAGPDLSSMTSAVDFGTVTTAILAVGAALIVVYIAFKGMKMLISAVRGA